MIDVLYVLGVGSKWADNELRYSLRSVEEHLPHRNIVISGWVPQWVQNVTHVRAGDRWSMPVRNTLHKLITACEEEAVGERFVLFNDDFLLLQPFNVDEPATVCGTMQQRISEGPWGADPHYDVLERGMEKLRLSGIAEPLNYEVHEPLVMERAKVLDMVTRWGLPTDRNVYPWRSVYGNLFRVPVRIAADVKQRRAFTLPVDGQRVISVDDEIVLLPEFQQWCSARWPNASRYEVAGT